MEQTSVTTVQIFGREYKIRGHADKNYIREMAKYVDDKMKELASNASLPSPDRLAILVALNIADELFQEKTKSSETISAVELRADRLINLLETGLLAEK
jgi:cell division protein ZapA